MHHPQPGGEPRRCLASRQRTGVRKQREVGVLAAEQQNRRDEAQRAKQPSEVMYIPQMDYFCRTSLRTDNYILIHLTGQNMGLLGSWSWEFAPYYEYKSPCGSHPVEHPTSRSPGGYQGEQQEANAQ